MLLGEIQSDKRDFTFSRGPASPPTGTSLMQWKYIPMLVGLATNGNHFWGLPQLVD